MIPNYRFHKSLYQDRKNTTLKLHTLLDEVFVFGEGFDCALMFCRLRITVGVEGAEEL